MSELSKVYLSSKVPLTSAQKFDCLTNIKEKAKSGFFAEIQKEVMAHTSEETFIFTIKKIEPKNKFYGNVDENTDFIIMQEDLPPIPKDPDTLEEIMKISNDLFPLLNEAEKITRFINDLQELRDKYNITWDCFHKVVSAIDQFNIETAPHL